MYDIIILTYHTNMTTLSVPINSKQESFINSYIKKGFASNKAAVVRRAIDTLSEEEAIFSVLRAEQEFKDGKILRGNLRDILKKFKD